MELERPRPKPSRPVIKKEPPPRQEPADPLTSPVVQETKIQPKGVPRRSILTIAEEPVPQTVDKLELVHLTKLVSEVVEVQQQEKLEEPVVFNSGLLTGDQVLCPIYPEAPPTSLPVSIKVNPLQLLAVNPTTFVDGEVTWDVGPMLSTYDPQVESEFELLLKRYLIAQQDKKKIAGKVKVVVFFQVNTADFWWQCGGNQPKCMEDD